MKKMLAALLAAVLTLCFAAALAEDTGLADVKAKGTLVMGFDEEYPPMGFVDENGELIPSDIEDRLISTPLEKLRAMDNVVGLAAGTQKAEAIRAVLRGGYLDVLITDEPTAALLLKGE